MNTAVQAVVAWNKRADAFTKIQGAYLALAVLLFAVAALVSLINSSLGHSFLFYALISVLTFIANGVIWALYRTFAMPYLAGKEVKTAKKPRSKR